MERIKPKISKKETRYDLIKKISGQLNDPIGKWLRLLQGWDFKDIDSVYRSSEALSKDKNMEFGKAWNWHIKEIARS